MKVFNKKTNIEKTLITLYFLIGLIEVIFQMYVDISFQYIIKISGFAILIALYWHSSSVRNPIYFINLLFLLIGRMFFISDDMKIIRYALICIFFHRIIEIYYVAKLIKLKDYIPPLLVSMPFLFCFLYLVTIPSVVMIQSYVHLIIQIILISVLSGIVLANYLSAKNSKNVWLLIFGLMSLSQTFVIFIEKFYLADLKLITLRPIALFLTTIICFSFYKFVITTERLNQDWHPVRCFSFIRIKVKINSA